MTVTPINIAAETARHLHRPFLERAADDEAESRPNALGAFLTLRLVDRITEDPGAVGSEALRYQLRACATYLDELYPQTEEINHLYEIVRVADSASTARNLRLLWAPMLAYAFSLEQQLRLTESLDVLDCALRLESASAIDEKTAALLQKGRVLRQAGRFEDANEAYAHAGELANLRGDLRSQMISRIGRAVILQRLGDLPSSETILAGVLEVARQTQDTYVEARALHGLAMTKHLMNRVPEAIALAYDAYRRYEEPDQQARAINDVGMFLIELGHYSAAKDAFLKVLETGPEPRLRVNTELELLELSAHVQDRLSFERWRRELEREYAGLPPAEKVDFEIKLGWGLATFGSEAEAKARLNRALTLAEAGKLNQRVFEAEQMLNSLRAGRHLSATPPVAREATPELDAVVAELQGASAS